MSKTARREAAALWRAEMELDGYRERSTSRAYYLPKHLADIGDTGDEELNGLVAQMQAIAYKIERHYETRP